jgi:hypothetical protein
MTFAGGDSDDLTLFYFNIKELFTVLGGDALSGEGSFWFLLDHTRDPIK